MQLIKCIVFRFWILDFVINCNIWDSVYFFNIKQKYDDKCVKSEN